MGCHFSNELGSFESFKTPNNDTPSGYDFHKGGIISGRSYIVNPKGQVIYRKLECCHSSSFSESNDPNNADPKEVFSGELYRLIIQVVCSCEHPFLVFRWSHGSSLNREEIITTVERTKDGNALFSNFSALDVSRTNYAKLKGNQPIVSCPYCNRLLLGNAWLSCYNYYLRKLEMGDRVLTLEMTHKVCSDCNHRELCGLRATLLNSNKNSKTILIVDDDSVTLTILATLLHSMSYLAICVDEPRVALNLLEQCNVDCIITDMVMPDMNGTELIQKVRQQGYKTPIIGSSGSGEHCVTMINSGADAYLAKPVNRSELFKTIEILTSDTK